MIGQRYYILEYKDMLSTFSGFYDKEEMIEAYRNGKTEFYLVSSQIAIKCKKKNLHKIVDGFLEKERKNGNEVEIEHILKANERVCNDLGLRIIKTIDYE